MIPFPPKIVPLSKSPIIFFHFVLLLIIIPRLPPSNSSPNPTTPTTRNFSDSTDPFRFPGLMEIPTNTQLQNKKLRRAPHVFSKVLELPLNSDADVSVQDRLDCLRFAAEFDCLGAAGDLTVLIVEPHPGIKKVLIRGGGDGVLFDELDVHVWRARLPENAWPEAANAACRGGRLVVTVPKIGGGGGGIENIPSEWFVWQDPHDSILTILADTI